MRACGSSGTIPLALLLVAVGIAGSAAAQEPRLGFSPEGRKRAAETERAVQALPTPESARRMLRVLTEEPHVAGTAADRATAEYVRDQLRSWGWEADLAEYEVLLNYPLGEPTLQIVGQDGPGLPVREEPYRPDKDSASRKVFPAFNGYGASGAVTAEVVYANYGRPADFDQLDRAGVEVKGRIVLVRYGELFRGLKVRNAQLRGAAGVLMYSDPAEDGYMRGDIYPDGPYRPASAIQRGSVQFLSLGPGDPTTPGWPSKPGGRRLPFDPRYGFPLDGADPANNRVAAWEKETGLDRESYFATIPSLPISYAAARPLLEGLGGPNVPSGWQGGLPFAYHLGPGPIEARMVVEMDYKLRPVWNVVATLRGSVEPDRWILIGNHRDAWTYGAVDPSSGTAATLEACRALGEAARAGWKPRRTLVYCSWDAEEYGLVGSTEWAEDHAEDLDDKAALMINVDSAVGGPNLDLDGIPSMRDLVLEAASTVRDARTGKPLDALWLERQRDAWSSAEPLDLDPAVWQGRGEAGAVPPGEFRPQMHPLGSGSDYTAFVHHLGIPAVDVNFTGRYGVYHAIYDDFYWMERFGDPGFTTHATAARLYAAIALRAASAEVLPLTFTPYADAIQDHVDDLRRMLGRKARLAVPPRVTATGFGPLVEAVRRFRASATALDRALAQAAETDPADTVALAALNDALLRVERAWLAPEGLPGRTWFQHTIYAPGLTTGYASWTLPGLRQAILQDDPAMLAEQLPIVTRQIGAATAALDRAIERAAALGPPAS